jgi:hypothetical protein
MASVTYQASKSRRGVGRGAAYSRVNVAGGYTVRDPDAEGQTDLYAEI